MPEPCGSFVVSCPRIFTGDNFLTEHCIVVANGRIVAVLPQHDRPNDMPHESLEQGFLAPGLVDLQVNGGGDVLFHNEPGPAAVRTIVEAHRKLGTTSLLPTLLSGNRTLRDAGIAAVESVYASEPGILGIHIEGPYFAATKHGAHLANALELPRDADIEALCGIDCPALVTLAPEVAGVEHIARLKDAGVFVWAGHTNATLEEMEAARTAGLRGVTHLYNAMSPLTGRAPGAVGAALSDDTLFASIIADGHHVHPASIAVACRTKPAGKVLLVSDAMATVGGKLDTFMLYQEQITLRNGTLRNTQGALAGSAIALIDAVTYTHNTVGQALDETLRMASRYPAEAIGLGHELGSLAKGYRADLIHLDEELNVLQVWVNGATLN